MSKVFLLLIFLGCSAPDSNFISVEANSILDTRFLNEKETQWYKEQVECFFRLGVIDVTQATELIIYSAFTVVHIIEEGGCFSHERNSGFDACYLDEEIYYSGERLGFDHEVGHDIENKIFGLPDLLESHSNSDFWELNDRNLYESRCQ